MEVVLRLGLGASVTQPLRETKQPLCVCVFLVIKGFSLLFFSIFFFFAFFLCQNYPSWKGSAFCCRILSGNRLSPGYDKGLLT